ncbi:hypothetical protein CALVIDRAFT_543232 [Calocera viscosa TUFC12733]|uniref:Uncharacterized protein n=1 Tax=Calocera viscosa (strain TUFC12733) TaxID=1330018 RepID=A0A167FUL4_CALVF|nr:hypothetical protein CALVIDRAFT_543232 [Calocera viscosa TUFC12733]
MSQLGLGGGLLAGEDAAGRLQRGKGKDVEKSAQALLAHFRSVPHVSLPDRLHNPSSFPQDYGNIALSGVKLPALGVRVLFKYLERDLRAFVTEGEVVELLHEARMARRRR